MRSLSKQNVKTFYASRFEATPEAIGVAKAAVQNLWNERQSERGDELTADRSGSCKFAALIARDLFGGRLAGNHDHVFVVLRDGTRIDLNADQCDVAGLGLRAHRLECAVLSMPGYRESLGSCTERARRWAIWAEDRLQTASPGCSDLLLTGT